MPIKPYNYEGENFKIHVNQRRPTNISISDEDKVYWQNIQVNADGFKIYIDNEYDDKSSYIKKDDLYEIMDFACAQIISMRCLAIDMFDSLGVEYNPTIEIEPRAYAIDDDRM